MKHLQQNEVMGFESRIKVLGSDAILAFPDDKNNTVLSLGGMHGYPEGRFSRTQLADRRRPKDIKEMLVHFPGATRATYFSEKRVIDDWQTLDTRLNPKGSGVERGDRPLSGEQIIRFSSYFNNLMDTATAENWLLGIGHEPQGSYDDGYPPNAEIYRILIPKENQTIGYREALGRGIDTYNALEDAVTRMGGVAIGG